MLSLSPSIRIFLCLPAVDLRKSFDGLSALVQQALAAALAVLRQKVVDKSRFRSIGFFRIEQVIPLGEWAAVNRSIVHAATLRCCAAAVRSS